ncbi:pitrilysin family protein [Mucilaginibacter gynuensis]|uniref:Pitrilysin family protein n=1 Tax=Mucilaginibacter gynuensis TaxID=1302236 RepID=A0ABP8G1Y1_9SPHI
MKTIIIKNIFPVVLGFMLTTAAAAQSAFKVPPFEKFRLPNGLTVYLMEQHEVPLVSLSVVLPAGAIYDGEKHGLASLTAQGLQYGTKSYTKAKIEQELDFIGANLNTYSSKEYASVSAKFAAKDADKVLPILNEVLTAPVFPAIEFEKDKKRNLSSLEQAKNSPRQVINAYWDHFIYGNHVYGNSVTGSPLTIGKLTADDLKAFYKANYAPDNAAIAVVGDFNAKVMKLKLSRLFSTWKKSGVVQNNQAAQAIATPTGARVLLVNKDDARETTMLIGGIGVKRNNPDYVAIEVVNTLFGGRFTSMLNDELRVNSGLTYGARSSFNSLKNSGTFNISTFTALKTTEATVDKALEVLAKLHKEGIDEKSLASAKNYVKGQFPPRYETSGQLADLLTQMFWYGFNESFINDFQANVDKLDLAQAKAIIAKYYPANNLQFVLVGKAADIKKIAEKYGKVTEKQIKEDGF